MEPTEVSLAVDIGGTKFAAGLVDGRGRLLAHDQMATPSGADAEELIDALVGLVRRVRDRGVERGWRAVVCGVGCGGPMTADGEQVSPLNIPGWQSFPLRRRLARATGLSTYVDNDAKALARAEGWVGAAVGRRHFMAMVVSTGVGGGIVVDGRMLDGKEGNAGHIGHVIVEPDGRACACGGKGCLEAEASGPSIAAATGGPVEDASLDVVVRTGTLVGRAVASVVNLLALELVVVGGSVALGFGDPFFDAAQRELDARSRLDYSAGAKLIPAGLGAEGPLVGAGAVGWAPIGR